MRTQTAPTIRLKDYTPPPYVAKTIDLTFALEPSATRVTARTMFERAEETAPGTPLRLDGDELKLERVTIDGAALGGDGYALHSEGLTIHSPPSTPRFETVIETVIDPQSNRKLMGLYRSSGVFCTQCEAEGFRRITYALDRPDVLSVYTARLEADRKTCPVLLSNGNRGEGGALPDGRHFAVWHDPHPKPCYLFALVAGRLDLLEDRFTTMDGLDVRLGIYVEPGKAAMADYAMGALKRSMRWDEEKWGRAYDLDEFNIVAVSDFNMGAMENKGLNIFNDKYVLADDETATDTDRGNIEAIIAHEYFHNWTGNRITCRDWFQLCLKEGLTVYRDQEFSADIRSRGVQRVMQVQTLKAAQFPEDGGPLAHPVRPRAYREINNFYTATVYQKGAELVRMVHAFLGPERFRAAMDLYFERHDGEAATVDEFLACFAACAEGRLDLAAFERWYDQAGTPAVTVEEGFDAERGRYTLTLTQETPPTPGRKRKAAVPIPIRFGLLDEDGEAIEAKTRSRAVHGDIIALDRKSRTVTFTGLDAKPVASLLRGFSAPVQLRFEQPDAERLLRARRDGDPYNRFAALNGLLLDAITGERAADAPLLEAVVATAFDTMLDAQFRALAIGVPPAMEAVRAIGQDVDPQAIQRRRTALAGALAAAFGSKGVDAVSDLALKERDADEAQAVGLRALRNTLAGILAHGQGNGMIEMLRRQLSETGNMTDRQAALSILLPVEDGHGRDTALATFADRHADSPLAMDKWFTAAAMQPGEDALARVQALAADARFTLDNPNRARSLLGGFAGQSLDGYHRADGAGYAFFADQVLALDAINPQVAARLLAMAGSWRMMEAGRREKARAEWQRIADTKDVSRDLREIVDRALDG